MDSPSGGIKPDVASVRFFCLSVLTETVAILPGRVFRLLGVQLVLPDSKHPSAMSHADSQGTGINREKIPKCPGEDRENILTK
jgi:hypothetical protein